MRSGCRGLEKDDEIERMQQSSKILREAFNGKECDLDMYSLSY